MMIGIQFVFFGAIGGSEVAGGNCTWGGENCTGGAGMLNGEPIPGGICGDCEIPDIGFAGEIGGSKLGNSDAGG